MPEAFKHLFDHQLLEHTAAVLQARAPSFDAPRFLALAGDGLDGLEMKARAMQICAALEATLPPRFDAAAALIESALSPPLDDNRLDAEPTTEARGLSGWILWPVGEFVARRGLAAPERALAVLHALTQRFTAEFALRPFLVQHPALTLRTLAGWTADPSAHVRRLVSEGSRPRLPWGLRLHALVADPAPTLPLLAALHDDPSEYVRRSVANHLNDIAKDHPALVAEWVERWLPGAPPPRRSLLRHACRTLIKQGDVRILKAWGLDRALRGEATLALAPHQVAVGESLQLRLTLQSGARQAQRLAIDYAVHHVKADGRRTPKVFKGWVLELAAGERRVLEKRHSMRAVTTRRYHPGTHVLDVRINGRVVAQEDFELRATR